MKITHNLMHNKCDMGGCGNAGEYMISQNEQNKKHNICFCSSCLKSLYQELGKLYTPKSVRNKLNRDFNNEIKNIFKKGENQ